MKITKDSTVREIIKDNPKAAEVFHQMGMKCLGCPSASTGLRPRLGDVLLEHREPEEVLDIVERILEFYQQNGRHNERIGRMIDRIGLDAIRAAVLREELVDTINIS